MTSLERPCTEATRCVLLPVVPGASIGKKMATTYLCEFVLEIVAAVLEGILEAIVLHLHLVPGAAGEKKCMQPLAVTLPAG